MDWRVILRQRSILVVGRLASHAVWKDHRVRWRHQVNIDLWLVALSLLWMCLCVEEEESVEKSSRRKLDLSIDDLIVKKRKLLSNRRWKLLMQNLSLLIKFEIFFYWLLSVDAADHYLCSSHVVYHYFYSSRIRHQGFQNYISWVSGILLHPVVTLGNYYVTRIKSKNI